MLKIGDLEVKLTPPNGYAARRSVVQLVVQDQLLAFAAALGLCWRDAPVRATLARAGYSMGEYGSSVIDELVEQGHDPQQVLAAGMVAWNQIAADVLPTEDEVAATEGFTDPPPVE